MSEPGNTTSRTLVRSSAVVAAGTGLSRVTGLLRTMAIAYALGTVVLGDAYNLANTTPNIVYDLVLGGILAATLVPVAVERFEADDAEAIDALATVITLILIALTIVATALAPLVIHAYTTSLRSSDPDLAARQTSLAVPLLVMFMPQVLFYGLSTLWTALLNARRSFAVPAFAPVLNNVIVICLFLALPHVARSGLTLESIRDDKALLLLVGLGTTAGIVAMALVLWPAMRHVGVRLHWNPDWHNPAVRTVARLSGWTFGYVIANQIGFLVLLTLINGTEQGAASAFTYAWQFFQLPYGLFTVSIMTTFTPELASHASRRDLGAFRKRFTQGLRLGLFVTLPATVVYIVLATPIVSVLLQRGRFGTASTGITSSVLVWLALGLPGFAVSLFTMRGFYAFKDTRTPFWLNLGETILQVALSIALLASFGLQGVVAGFSIAYTILAVVSVAVLRRRTQGLGDPELPVDLAKLVAAAVVMAAVGFGVTRLAGGGDAHAVAQLVGGLAAGLVAYVGVLALTRSGDLGLIRAMLRDRTRAGAPPLA